MRLRDGDDVAVEYADERLSDSGIGIVNVAGVSHRADVLQDERFAPGRAVALVRDPKNKHDENAVGVWDKRAAYASRLGTRLRRPIYAGSRCARGHVGTMGRDPTERTRKPPLRA